MSENDFLRDRAARWCVGALLAALTGCTTYVEAPRPAPVYAPPPPLTVREEVVVTPPPPPPVATPVVVTAPPPPPPPGPLGNGENWEIHRESDFYEPLSPYGHWVVMGDLGRCWVPDRVERDWRPYTNGHWRRTEAGWYWVSEEPWGWATYHYGRWDWLPETGWFWLPQTQWAPAWVEFHEGGGYTGWAPLPPAARLRGDRMEAPARPDRERDRGLVLVEQRRFLEPVRPATVVVNNTTIINQTVNITSVKVVNNTVINEGPRVTVIEQASGRKVESAPAHELRHQLEGAARETHLKVMAQPGGRPSAAPPVTAPRPGVLTGEGERRGTEAQKAAAENEARRAREEAARREEAAKTQAQAEALRQSRTAEAQAAAAEAQRRANVIAAQAEAQRRSAVTNAQAQAEALRQARQAEARAAQAEAQRRSNSVNAPGPVPRRPAATNVPVPVVTPPRTNVRTAPLEGPGRGVVTNAPPVHATMPPQTNEAPTPPATASPKPARGEPAAAALDRIKAAMAADPQLKGVQVVQSNGIIHLQGFISSTAQKNRAEGVARQLVAGRPVQNDLKVGP